MLRRLTILTLLPAVLAIGCSSESGTVATSAESSASSPEPVTAEAVLENVIDAMGLSQADSITYAGTAWRIRNGFRQTPSASPPWEARDQITNYRRALDLASPASRATGETFAQNMFLAPATAGTYTQNISAEQTNWGQQLEIWLTPWGFLEGAERNGVEMDTRVVDGTEYTVLTWQSPETQTAPSGLRYTVNGYITADNLIERVETWVDDPFMGDLHVEGRYADYTSLNGLMVPATMEQHRAGGAVFGVDISEAAANPANLSELLAVPEGGGRGGFGGGAPGGEGEPADLVEQIDEGVWLVNGGYVALVAEFEDHLLVFEAGQNEDRGEQIIDEIKRALPDKPIRFVLNSHPHSDHTAGLVPFVREGAALVTHASNVEFLNMALSTPRTLLGEDTLNPQLEGVEGIGVYEDETMRVELHHVPNGHSEGMLVAVLPEQGIMFQADFSLPQGDAEANPFVVTLAEYVDEQGLDFERYLAVHPAPAPQTKADLMAAIGQ